MEEKQADGRFPSDASLVERTRAAFNYFRFEGCRTDIVRAKKENWFHPQVGEMDLIEWSADLYNPYKPDRSGIAAMRDATADVNKTNFDNALEAHPEWDEWGYFKEYRARPCVEEPDGPEVPILVHHLRESFVAGPKPVLLIPSWGGLMNNDLYGFMPITLAHFLRAQVITVSPRSIADAPYPAAVNDMHAAYQWMVDNAAEFNFDLDRVVIYGMSGCSIPAQTISFRLKRYGWLGAPKPRGIVIEDGFFDDCDTTRSSRTLTTLWDPISNRCANMLYMGHNFASPFIGPEAYANHATVDECRGLPPHALMFCQESPGAGSAREFADKLDMAGVAVALFQQQCASHERPSDPSYVSAIHLQNTEFPFVPRNDLKASSNIDNFLIGCIRDYFDNDFRRD